MAIKKSFCTLIALFLFFSFGPTAAFASHPTNRLSGETRYETAIAISQQGWVRSDFAIIASGERFQDALLGAPLAALYNCPILLTTGSSLDDRLKSELKRLGVRNTYIVGNFDNVSLSIEQQLGEMLGIETIRLAGKTDYGTSILVAQKFEATDTVVLVNSGSYADALSIAPIAAAKKYPILFTDKNSLSEDIAWYIASSGVKKTYIIGGTGVISDSVASQVPGAERIWGQDRYDTNMQVISHFSSDIQKQKVYFCTGENYPDALAGTALAQATKSPLVLMNPSEISETTRLFLCDLANDSLLTLLGGAAVISDDFINQMESGAIHPGYGA